MRNQNQKQRRAAHVPRVAGGVRRVARGAGERAGVGAVAVAAWAGAWDT